jgi:hypothetical protein
MSILAFWDRRRLFFGLFVTFMAMDRVHEVVYAERIYLKLHCHHTILRGVHPDLLNRVADLLLSLAF